jgi:hypothetical protein
LQRLHRKKKVNDEEDSDFDFIENKPLIVSSNSENNSSPTTLTVNKPKEEATATSSTPSSPTIPVLKPEPKKVVKGKKAAYVSMKNLLQAEEEHGIEKNEYVDDSDEDVKAALANITEEELKDAWSKLHEHFLNKGESSFASSILASKPDIVDGLLQLKVVNLIQKKNFEEFNEELLVFVKKLLGVSKLKINIEVEKNEDGGALPYTDKEKLLVMAKDNPALLTLQQTFGLEPEF